MNDTSKRLLLSSLTVILGVAIIVAHPNVSTRSAFGNVLSVLMTAATASVTILMKRHPRLDSKVIAFFTCLVTMVLCVPFSHIADFTPGNLPPLCIYGISGGFAFVCLVKGVRLLSSVQASLISTLEVVLAPMWVFIAFGETPTISTMLGGILVLTSVINCLARPSLSQETG